MLDKFIVIPPDWDGNNFSKSFFVNNDLKDFEIKNYDIFSKLNANDVIYINSLGYAKRFYDANTRSLDLLMTTHCNSNCIMCPLSEGARQSKECGYYEWLKNFVSILPSNVENICITGGEPTLYPDHFIEIVKLLKNKFISSNFQLLTNGRSMADFDFCQKTVLTLPNKTMICVPLHAGNKKLYDEIAQINGGFEQACDGIKNLLHYHQIVEIRVVVSKLNAVYLQELSELIVKNFAGISHVTFIGMETMGNAVKNIDEVWIDYTEAMRFIEPSIDYLCENGIDVRIYNFPLCFISKKYWFLANRSITPSKVRYYKECEECVVRESCSGFFESTFRVKRMKIKPIGAIQ